MDPIDLKATLTRINEHYSPRIIAGLNGQEVKLAKLLGPFDWHAHQDADELFLVVEGSFTMEFRDRSVELREGQVLVVPRGVEHRPVAEKECFGVALRAGGRGQYWRRAAVGEDDDRHVDRPGRPRELSLPFLKRQPVPVSADRLCNFVRTKFLVGAMRLPKLRVYKASPPGLPALLAVERTGHEALLTSRQP